MGLTIWSYNIRWRNRSPNGRKSGWRNALDVLDHCRDLGAGCLQIGAQGWQKDFVRQVRDKRENLGIAIEGQIGLPRNKQDLGRFEAELLGAREAGATVLRSVCLNGRRYEKFGDKESWERFRKESLAALQRAEPIAARHKMKLAVETTRIGAPTNKSSSSNDSTANGSARISTSATISRCWNVPMQWPRPSPPTS